MDIQKELKKPFPKESIKWRVGATSKDKTKGIALAYIDARDVMERLDDVVGFQNWQCRYPIQGICEIGIKIDGEWIWKANGAGETQVEAEKGQASDAFKRAAVMWGVGQYLYKLENNWVSLDSYRKIITPPNLPKWALPEDDSKGIPEPKQEDYKVDISDEPKKITKSKLDKISTLSKALNYKKEHFHALLSNLDIELKLSKELNIEEANKVIKQLEIEVSELNIKE